MKLVQAVEFRELVSQLITTETQDFITELALCDPQLVIDSDPQFVINSLSSLFIQQAANTDDGCKNALCNKMICTIIQSRDTVNFDVNDERFDTLPRRIIGLCASYLDQSSYVALSATNRSTYLGCSTPITLREIKVNYKWRTECVIPDLSAFPFATKLTPLGVTRTSNDESSIIATQITRMPRLHSLDLSYMRWDSIGIIADDNATNERITSASFYYMHYESDPEELQQFLDLMALFKNIQFLKVRMIGPSADGVDWNIESLITSLSNLKGLDFDDNGTGIERHILQSIGHRLQCLALHDRRRDFSSTEEAKHIDFANLRQLWQRFGCKTGPIQVILETAVHLEKVRLTKVSELMLDIPAKYKELKYLEIQDYDWTALIENGKMKHILQSLEHNEFLKIRMNTSIPSEDKYCEKCIEELYRVSNVLSKKKRDQWMLILDFKEEYRFGREGLRQNKFLQDLRLALDTDISNTTVFQEQEGDCAIVLITSRGNSICEWRESWLMSL